MNRVQMDECVAPAPHVSTAPLEGEVVLLNVETGDCYTLDKVGAWLWARLDGTRTMVELAEELTSAFDVSRERAEGDLAALVGELIEEGLALVGGKEPEAGK